MDKLEQAYTMDLLARLTESIETYLDDDRWDGIHVMHQEIKEANKLVRKYYKRLKLEQEVNKNDYQKLLIEENTELRKQLKSACNALMERKLT
jgi:hypothetical protein